MYAYFTVLNGEQIGDNLPLDAEVENLVGRGGDCQVALQDRICSRVHAIVRLDDEAWVIADADSRNGTFVNGQKVAEATLADGHTVKIGATELEFHQSADPLTAEDDAASLTQTIVQNMEVSENSLNEASLTGLPNAEQVKELMLLYQLCIRLLGSGDTDQVVHTALDLLKTRTSASVVGFLWLNEQGELRPKMVLPTDAASRVSLSPSLTELVSKQGHAVWVANQGGKDATEKLEHFADAICAPLVKRSPEGERNTLGAIHVYLEAGRFRQSDFDFIISVANIVVTALARAMQFNSMRSNYERLVSTSPGYDELIGESEPMLALKNKISRVARAAGCVLVRGESGAGKELVARAIHRASPRAERPMVSVNCAAIPADLMESQLFGHKAGSFTGADRDHTGYFQQADLGTLFLDEVGEMTLEGQAKLLRVMEGHPFLPVGATEPISVDVRVVAATNQDLQDYVRKGKFREDLYYRLSVFELYLPPLRDRDDDIGRLVEFFLDHFRKQHGRPGLRLSSKAVHRLLEYRWPGNVRQLRNVIDSAVVMADGDEIEPGDLALRDSGREELDTLQIDQWEKKLIIEALKRTSDNVPEAAKLLGIGRATLYRKIEQYHIER
ncbi:Nitrogen regulation protein NR(I) [Posidoniimonas polymericola]|uniref:Nitrogen regulation protein NR(I) n=1 Tax=Posidoniimonas polymericola TaxID=2528002 RepID=A0A5C5YRH4_9BACT|nr:sigma 54-interacting transcriptional regulator [Posidoniimonas polymericola]TWT77320.1 Nitrogen regulation protein NR(I) [Posidoniimonas polymericola]